MFFFLFNDLMLEITAYYVTFLTFFIALPFFSFICYYISSSFSLKEYSFFQKGIHIIILFHIFLKLQVLKFKKNFNFFWFLVIFFFLFVIFFSLNISIFSFSINLINIFYFYSFIFICSFFYYLFQKSIERHILLYNFCLIFSLHNYIASFLMIYFYLTNINIYLPPYHSYEPSCYCFNEEYLIQIKSFLFVFRFDSISLLFINLTTLLIFLCILAANNTYYQSKSISLEVILLIFIESLLVLSFITSDILIFFFCFEAILIPMTAYILILGSHARQSYAFKYFFFFSFFGSLLMLFSLLILLNTCGTTNIISVVLFKESYSLWVTLPFCIGLMVKIPMFPFYIWLPEAHVEAPTTGSMILAGILLKLGGYGFLRFFFPLIGSNFNFYQGLIFICAILGVFISSSVILTLYDLKKIIAFSSIIHMNIGMVSLFSGTLAGLTGFTLLMVSHGLVSAGLFFLVGIIYTRFGTRLFTDFRGLITVMPYFVFFFLVFTLSNISFPGSLNFISEFLLFIGLSFNSIFIAALLLFISYFLGGTYSIVLFTRISSGIFEVKDLDKAKIVDISYLEFFVLIVLLLYIAVFGIFPTLIGDFLSLDLKKLHMTLLVINQ